MAQQVFNFGFLLPFAPESPDFFLIPGDNQVTVLWRPSPTETDGRSVLPGGQPADHYRPGHRHRRPEPAVRSELPPVRRRGIPGLSRPGGLAERARLDRAVRLSAEPSSPTSPARSTPESAGPARPELGINIPAVDHTTDPTCPIPRSAARWTSTRWSRAWRRRSATTIPLVGPIIQVPCGGEPHHAGHRGGHHSEGRYRLDRRRVGQRHPSFRTTACRSPTWTTESGATSGTSTR